MVKINEELPVWTILLCCRNAKDRILPTLEALAKLNNVDECEYVMVDSSTDDTLEIVKDSPLLKKFHSFTLVKDFAKGLGYGRAKGLPMANGKYICCVDDDNFMAPDYLEKGQRHFEANPSVGSVGGQSFLPDGFQGPLWMKYFGHAYAVGSQFPSDGLLPWGRAIWGAGMCLRTSAWRKVEEAGFKPFLGTFLNGYHICGDDTEAGLSVSMVGGQAYYDSTMTLVHAIDSSRLNMSALTVRFINMGLAVPIFLKYTDALAILHPNEINQKRTKKLNAFSNAWGMLLRGIQRTTSVPLAEIPYYLTVGAWSWLACWYGLYLARKWTQGMQSEVEAQIKRQIVVNGLSEHA